MEVINFIHDTNWNDFPEEIKHQARRCLLDALGAGIAGRQTELSQIIHDFAASVFGGTGAYLWVDGREVSPPGAALANGMTIDALDIHDGHPLVKGHAGVAIVPAVLATIAGKDNQKVNGQELLTALIIGYEVALRAGIALHATACDYHTSGAWNALGCAAVTARRLGLGREKTRHALGVAEYHGPRSQMMRCIDHPTMLKDGSGWGSMAGVSGALLAQGNFSGAPALTVEADAVKEIWTDLGAEWQFIKQYFKPHAVCRWAQPAVEGAQALQKKYQIASENVKGIKVYTFHEAARLTCRHPQTTEASQYSLPFPVAAILIYGRLGPEELRDNALKDSAVLRLSDCVELIEDAAFSQRFPAKRFARVEIETKAGHVYDSGEVQANWEAETTPTDRELRQKFRWLTQGVLTAKRASELEEMVWRCAELPDAASLLPLLTSPITSA
ncbi:MAG: MmgE/PrpD family protein [Planctomycetota bacterium]|jgi:2-methylcitrate dehydratase PrpD